MKKSFIILSIFALTLMLSCEKKVETADYVCTTITSGAVVTPNESFTYYGKTVSEIEEIERIGTVVTEAEYAGKLINARYVTVCVKK